ncbi:MAG: hypothetical protein E7171_01010 [Firmicutes bacterium]|nr:hypothetical protein [Bacillota bacterium]
MMPKLEEVRNVVKKISSIDELKGRICFFGGAMPYIYHGEESGREHSDIDVLVDEEVMGVLRDMFKKAENYRPHLDSINLGLDKDYGFKIFIDGVYVEFEPMSIKDGHLIRSSFSPDKEFAGTEVIPFLEMEDVVVPITVDGISTHTESMELIRASKAKYERDKDLKDIAFIDSHGIDPERYARVVACLKQADVSMSSYEELRRIKKQ